MHAAYVSTWVWYVVTDEDAIYYVKVLYSTSFEVGWWKRCFISISYACEKKFHDVYVWLVIVTVIVVGDAQDEISNVMICRIIWLNIA